MRPSRRIDYDLASRFVGKSFGLSREELEASFSPATSADMDELLRLRGTHPKTGRRPDDPRYLRWRYDLTGDDPGRAIWLFRHRGELIGTLGVERDVLTHARTDVVAHKLMDILAREDYMGSGIGVWMSLRLQQVFENTLCIGSTPDSHSIVTRLNTQLPDWQTWRYAVSLRRKHALLAAVDALLGARRRLSLLLVRRDARLLKGDELRPGSRILRDTMAARCIMPSRGIEKATWRFREHPYRTYSHFHLLHGAQLVASLTVARSGLRAELSDALVLEAGPPGRAVRRLFDLLTLATEVLAGEGVEVLSTRANDPTTSAALRRAGFVRRDESCEMGYHFRDPTLAGWMEERVPLFLMPADSDFD